MPPRMLTAPLAILLLAAAAPGDTLKVVPPTAVEVGVTKKTIPYTARITKVTGSLDVSADLAAVKLTLDLRADTLAADGDKLTAQLRDLFDVAAHPTATLKTTGARAIRDDAGHTHLLTADLTLRGVTRAVTIPVSVQRTDSGVKLTGKVTVNRKDFGMTGDFGNDVTFTLTVHGGK